MKYLDESAMYRRSLTPCAKVSAKNRHAPAVAIELKMLRLAADAADLRRELTPQQLAKWERLAAALNACEALFEELGWGDQPGHADAGDNSGH
jgi:hypothetical protein